MPKEADFYTPGEAANVLGLTEFTILGLLTSGQLEGHQDEQARWWIPAAAVNEAVRRDRDTDPLVDPSAEETIAMEAVSPGPRDSEDTTTQYSSSEAAELRARLELTERAESSLREDLERVSEERRRHQEEAERLREELESERSKGCWRRLFGG